MSSLKTFLWTRKRIKQKATVGSAMVVLMLFGLFLEAYMHNFNLVYIVLFFVFALAFIAAITGIWNLSSLKVTLERCDRLFAHETSHAYLLLYNDKMTKSYALSFNCNDTHFFISSVEPQKATPMTLPLTPKQRGTLLFHECILESRFPLSTARLLLSVGISSEFTVYPQPNGLSLDTFLNRHKSYYGEENEFEGIMLYNQEAPLSRIHWPSVAKGERAVKKYNYDMPLATLVFDFYSAGQDDETRLSQLTLWILECEMRQLDFKIQMPGCLYDSKRSSVDEILEQLAHF